jgi:hypothetical protein
LLDVSPSDLFEFEGFSNIFVIVQYRQVILKSKLNCGKFFFSMKLELFAFVGTGIQNYGFFLIWEIKAIKISIVIFSMKNMSC